MKEQTRNTEVQINEEEIGKVPEKEFRVMTRKMMKNLENKMEKMQESINKDLEELNIQRQTAQLLKFKTLSSVQLFSHIQLFVTTWKQSTAEYLKQKHESVSWKIKWWKQLLKSRIK